jgi:hypothetical protein
MDCYTLCKKHLGEHQIELYFKKPIVVWDEKSPLYSDYRDEFYYSVGEIKDLILDNPSLTLENLMLVMCRPIKWRELDKYYWLDDAPSDVDIPKGLEKVIDTFNTYLKSLPTFYWEPIATRPDLDLIKSKLTT